MQIILGERTAQEACADFCDAYYDFFEVLHYSTSGCLQTSKAGKGLSEANSPMKQDQLVSRFALSADIVQINVRKLLSAYC